MAKRYIEDRILLTVPSSADTVENRWWEIRQPSPSIAFALLGKFQAALGPRMGDAIHKLLRASAAMTEETDDSGEPSEVQDFAVTEQTMGEAVALAAWRNARSGKALMAEGEELQSAGDRLRIILGWITRSTGVDLQSIELYGDFERLQNHKNHKWTRGSLLHRLLLASEISFLGDGPKPVAPSGAEKSEHLGDPLFRAVQSGSISQFVQALDELLISHEELALLCTWSLIHLVRPF